MGYTRAKTRGEILNALDCLPQRVTKEDMPQLHALLAQVMTIYKMVVNEPFEYLSDETKEEHRILSGIFGRLMALLHRHVYEAIGAFQNGADEYELPSSLRDIRDELEEKSEGSTAFEILMSRVAKDEVSKE